MIFIEHLSITSFFLFEKSFNDLKIIIDASKTEKIINVFVFFLIKE